MAEFSDFIEETPHNDRIIQHALREIDSEVLAVALVGMQGDHKRMVYRNVSRRVIDILEEEMRDKSEFNTADRVEDAKAFFLGLLGQAAKRLSHDPDRKTGPVPEIRMDTHEEIIDSFRELATYVRQNGFLPLQAIEDQIPDPLMRKGLRFLIDGTDPMLTRSLLERYKTTLLKDAETRYDMILDGIDTLSTRYLPQLVEDRLRTHIVS